MKRIFTAIDISDETRIQCADYIEKLRSEFADLRVGWDKPEKLHLTMKFLGDIDENQLQNLTEAVEATARQFAKFSLKISKTGAFPAAKNARILWLGVADEQGILPKLNRVLETECEQRGLAKEKRNFKAHLTIARLREPQNSARLVEKHLSESFESEEFTVSGITIYESRLQKSGSIYQQVSGFRFKVKNQLLILNLESET